MIIALALIVGALSNTPVTGNVNLPAERPVDRYGRASNPSGIVRVVSNLDAVAVSKVQGRKSPNSPAAINKAASVMVIERSNDVFGRT
jgi:hypothetical protein